MMFGRNNDHGPDWSLLEDKNVLTTWQHTCFHALELVLASPSRVGDDVRDMLVSHEPTVGVRQ